MNAERLKLRKKELLSEISVIDKAIFLLSLNGFVDDDQFIRWIYYVDKCLLYLNGYVCANQIISILIEHPAIKAKSKCARRSVSSVLSIGCRTGKYLYRKEGKLTLYNINNDYPATQ